jgi:hypothetical protein
MEELKNDGLYSYEEEEDVDSSYLLSDDTSELCSQDDTQEGLILF